MGSYATLSIGGYDLVSTKSFADTTVMSVFREQDRRARAHPGDGEVAEGWTWAPTAASPPPARSEESLEEAELDHAYVAPVWVIRDRLEVMGFTAGLVRSEFQEGVTRRILELRSWDEGEDEVDGLWRDEVALLERYTFDTWLEAFQYVKARGGHSIWHNESVPEEYGPGYLRPSEVSPVIRYMLEDEDGERLMGFPLVDVRVFLRAALEAFEDDALVVEDLSDITSAGYCTPQDRVADDARVHLLSDYPANARTIVLTEGSSDRSALEGSLRLLYPHLVDYYAFMDFSGMAMPGGAGHLVATVKAFAGAGIANRVVAMFDNYAAARDAMRALDRITLPKNIKAMRYPPLQLAAAYPSIGPAGPATTDVNGRAGSLELYFGEDVLRGDAIEAELTPVQWKGLVSALGDYQGEVLNKEELQARFARKLERAGSDSSLLQTLDWSGIRAVLDALRGAFRE